MRTNQQALRRLDQRHGTAITGIPALEVGHEIVVGIERDLRMTICIVLLLLRAR